MSALGEELGETAGPARGVQRHAGLATSEALCHDRLVGGKQTAACVCVIPGELLLVGGDGADPLGEHATPRSFSSSSSRRISASRASVNERRARVRGERVVAIGFDGA
jgi:hypothetical protein